MKNKETRHSVFSAQTRGGQLVVSVMTWPPIQCNTCKRLAAFLVNRMGPDSRGNQCLNCDEP